MDFGLKVHEVLEYADFYHIDKNFLPTIEFPKNSYILYF